MIRMQSEGTGPRYIDLKNSCDAVLGLRKSIIRFLESDLDAWCDSRRSGGATHERLPSDITNARPPASGASSP
jgi:hypothetical protein